MNREGRVYEGNKIVRAEEKYKIEEFKFDEGDYLVAIQGSQSLNI